MDNMEFCRNIRINGNTYQIYDINLLDKKGIAETQLLPFSIRILVENLLRKLDDRVVKESDLANIASWHKRYDTPIEIPYHPARVLMQDFTGVPAVVDLAAMRDAIKVLGKDPGIINPLVPVDLIIDHSIQLDYSGTEKSLNQNVEMEYKRNGERYALLKWAQKHFNNFKIVPPNSGICHQVNLEYLGQIVMTSQNNGKMIAHPDTLVGTDSHTPMINGIGVLGWGVGGIEAEAVMLGQPYYMSIPEVVGVKMVGELREGVTATDLVLFVTELLRKQNVVEKFVEYFGPGMKNLSVPDRATIANMSPEYGSTIGFFPVDEKTIDYLRMTSRKEQADIVEAYAKELGMFYSGDTDPEYSEVMILDLSHVEPSVAGPSRPQDRIELHELKEKYTETLDSSCTDGMHDVNIKGKTLKIGNGSVVIAAITSCTNTSNPAALIGAGLVAKKAVERGLRVPGYVKTSLAPGSKVVSDYLKDSGLLPFLETLGFYIAGYGCTTCIGNSGPIHHEIEDAIIENNLNVAAVLSGNRNFEARIHQSIKSNFLMSPMLVVLFAIAGRITIDLTKEPIAIDHDGNKVYLKDIWPEKDEINAICESYVRQESFQKIYAEIFDGDDFWKNLSLDESMTFTWENSSTYIKHPPYFENFSIDQLPASDIENAKALLLLEDSVTTDHISPAGAIPVKYPAGQYLTENGVVPEDFNSYGSRRGNHEVMMRGTFGNIRIKNQLVAPKEGSFTKKLPEGTQMYIYDAAMKYKESRTPLLVLGGKEYGSGSSRDWAAKGTSLLGIKAIIAESYERIHRSNLVGMGVLPLIFKDGNSWASLGLDGSETFSINGIKDMKPRKQLQVMAAKKDGTSMVFDVIARLDTDMDVAYFENSGILPYVLRKLIKTS